MAHGKQIRLFLADGDASGIRYAELVNWTGQAFSLPWLSRPRLKDWDEAHRPGVYALVGLDEEGRGTVYIGETEQVFNRLVNHASNPPLEEIVEVLFFSSKDQNLTKGHVTFLESHLIKRAEQAKRKLVKYGRMPGEKPFSRPETATMEEFLENIFLVTSALGYDIFDLPKAQPVPTPHAPQQRAITIFEVAFAGGLMAKGYRSDDGFVVTAGSNARPTEADTLGDVYKSQRVELNAKEVLVEQEGKLVFSQDYAFTSSSAAASVITGSQRSGPRTWLRVPDRTPLKEVEAEEAAAEAQPAPAEE